MSKVCDVCGKAPAFGNKVSHSNRKTRRRWNVNIQSVRASHEGKVQSVNVCAKCLKANKVTKVI